MTRAAFFALSVWVFALAGCRPERTRGTGCNEDQDCVKGGEPVSSVRCETQTGVCYCRTDDACAPSELCNLAGFCQDRTGCTANSDCLDPSLFCETTTGTCLPRGRCSSDLHCKLGEVCDTGRSTCVAGCRSHGDCPGSSCRCGDVACGCDAGSEAERAQCAIGVCDPSFCADQSFCAFGQICGAPPDAGAAVNQCYSDFDDSRRPYCNNCVFGAGTSVCGNGPHFCLIDTAHPGNYFCGVDCSQGQQCPNGYACSDVIVVLSQWQCNANTPCPVNTSLPCQEDANCKRGGKCVKLAGQPSGFCAGRCNIDEGDAFGYCSCLESSDCPTETCSAGECSITRRRCVDSSDCVPPKALGISCVDFQGGGGCLIGQNCAPANGLSCIEVR